MKFKTQLCKFDSNLWGHHIIVPLIIADALIEGNHRRIICTLNGVHSFQAALMPNKGKNYFININKEIRKKLDLEIGTDVEVTLEKDNSEYGLPMPEELKELLALDDEGNKYFHTLTPGKQRSLLFIVGKPKTSNTRLKKAIVLVDYLKATKGKLDFKELHQAFKDSK